MRSTTAIYDYRANIEIIEGPESIREAVRSLLREASREVLLSLPVAEVPTVRETLATAVDDGVAVLVLLYGPGELAEDVSDMATVVRRMEGKVPLSCTVDESRTLVGWPGVLSPASDDEVASLIDNEHAAVSMFGEFVGNYWAMGRELYVAPPPALPRTYEAFRGAVIGTTLHLRQGSQVRVVCEAVPTASSRTETTELTGRALDVRQGFVYPMTNRFPAENGLVIRAGGERLTVGGVGAYRETYAAGAVRLEPV